MTFDVALVTITYNCDTVWGPFIACIIAQRDVDWHLYVIDNQSYDKTIPMLETIEDPRVSVFYNETNLGVAAGNNQGIAAARAAGARRIVLINNDTVFAPDLLANLGARLDTAGADAVSPLIPYFDDPNRIWYGGGSFCRMRGIMNRHDNFNLPLEVIGASPFVTDYAPTCCVMFRSDVFDDVGMMDDRYFVYWDDSDFMWRMKMAGKRLLLDPSSVLLHKVSVSTGGRLSDFSIRYNFRNQIFFSRKFHPLPWTIYTAVLSAAAGFARIFMCGDSVHHFVGRLKAISEGFGMSKTSPGRSG